MKPFAMLSAVAAAVLVLLQFGGDTCAEPSPLPILPGLPSLPLTSLSPKPAAAVPVYPAQTTYPYLPQQPAEFEGLSSNSYMYGKGNTDFTGIDLLGNLNAPVNAFSITDVLN